MSLTTYLLCATLHGQEPQVPYTATVIVTEAEVRSGAGDSKQLYPTNRLHKGDKVEVVRQLDGGWLAIKPPAGSFSWINSRFVRRIGNTMHHVVIAHPDTKVPVLFGSSLKTDKPTVEGTKVSRGTQLRSIGPMRLGDDGYWLPVDPPPGEVRYLRVEAVSSKADSAVASSAEPPGGLAPSQGTPAAGSGPHPLWVRAQQAEQLGRYAEAIQLYQQLSADVATRDRALSEQASNKAQNLSAALAGQPPTRPLNGGPSPTTTTSAMSPTAPPSGMVNSGAGWLRRAGPALGYNTLFVLENGQGVPIVYATAAAGYSLDVYTNHNVELIGTRQYRNDLRAYQMTVMQIRPLR